MQHPNRPHSPQSIHSYWSDSKSLGPTISIHAAAKPLMKLMYHRQVQSFIKKNQDANLTEEILEISFSYLAYKYISPATKSLILNELNRRIVSEKEHAIIHPCIRKNWALVAELLSSGARMHMFDILHSLGASSYDAVSWAFWICPRMGIFINGTNDTELQCLSLRMITQISATSEGAQALTGSTIWEYICNVRDCLSNDMWPMISSIVRNLTMSINKCFIQITRDAGVEQYAMRAIVDVNAREFLARSFRTEPVNAIPRRDPTFTLRYLELLNVMAVLDWHGNLYRDPGLSLSPALAVFLLGSNNRDVRHVALDILWKVSHFLEAAREIEETFFEYVPDLLDNPDLRLLTCDILGNISRVSLDKSTKEHLRRRSRSI